MELQTIVPKESEKLNSATRREAGESSRAENENYGSMITSSTHNEGSVQDTSGETSCLEILQSAVGVALAIIGGVFYATEGLFVALAQQSGLSPLVVFFLMQLFLVLTLLIPMIVTRPRLVGKTRRLNGLLLINAAGYVLNELNYVYAISFVPIGNVTAIINGTLPVFTALLAMFFLKEAWKKLDFVVTIFNICGIILISSDELLLADELEEAELISNSTAVYENITLIVEEEVAINSVGYGLAVLAGLGNAISVTTNRRLEEVSVLTRLLYDAIISIILSGFAFIYVAPVVWPEGFEPYLYNFGAGLTDMLALAAAYSSLHTENAATVAVILNLEIVISYILGYAVLGEIPTSLDATGATLVFTGSTTVFLWTWFDNFRTSRSQNKAVTEEGE